MRQTITDDLVVQVRGHVLLLNSFCMFFIIIITKNYHLQTFHVSVSQRKDLFNYVVFMRQWLLTLCRNAAFKDVTRVKDVKDLWICRVSGAWCFSSAALNPLLSSLLPKCRIAARKWRCTCCSTHYLSLINIFSSRAVIVSLCCCLFSAHTHISKCRI